MMVDGLSDPSEPSWRTLAEIPDDPPQPLLLGILEPDGPTLAYAAPGVGKGTTGAWMIVELQRLGMRPAIPADAAEVSARMRLIRGEGTNPELQVQELLSTAGLSFIPHP